METLKLDITKFDPHDVCALMEQIEDALNSAPPVPWYADPSITQEEKDAIADHLAAEYEDWSYDRAGWSRG